MTEITVTKTAEDAASKAFKVTVPVDRVRAAEERAVVEYGRRVRLPGFRQGKAPIAVIRKRFGDEIKQYVVDLTTATRSTPALRLGASPRASLHLLSASRAFAALAGRDHVLPDDVQRLLEPVLAHRMIPAGETQAGRRTNADVLHEIVRRVPIPAAAR